MLGSTSTPAPVLVVQFVAGRLTDYQRVAGLLRAAGVGAEVYPDVKKIGVQLQYAEKRGFKLALIAGPDELSRAEWKIKDLARRAESSVPEASIVGAITQALGSV
jgi:histidyl-tRNA synthetase